MTGAIAPAALAPIPKVNLPEAIQKKLKNERITYIVLSILTLGIYALAVFIMDKIQAKWINPLAFMPSTRHKPIGSPHPDRIQIPTYDKVNLDAREVLCETPTNKWVIYFCPNAALYEEVMPYVDAGELGANVLFFNYRDCGHSEGTLKGATDLLLDGCAVIEHLKRKGVENKDILLSGFSIGGALALTAAEHYQGIKYLGDRTLASISATVTAFATCIAGAVVKLTRFEIPAFKAWKNIPDQHKAVIYHPKDGIIRKPASLYTAEKKLRKKEHPEWQVAKTTKAGKQAYGLADQHKPTHVKLVDKYPVSGQYAHCRPHFPEESAAIVAIARQLLLS